MKQQAKVMSFCLMSRQDILRIKVHPYLNPACHNIVEEIQKQNNTKTHTNIINISRLRMIVRVKVALNRTRGVAIIF